MTIEQQKVFLLGFQDRMTDAIISKQADYATEDVLSNFKLAGNICGINPSVNCLSLIATKVFKFKKFTYSKLPLPYSFRQHYLEVNVHKF